MSSAPESPALPSAPPRRPGASLTRAVGRWITRTLRDPEPVWAAVEVRPDSVGVVRLARDGRDVSAEAAAAVDLPDGCLKLSMSDGNIEAPDVFRERLRSAMEKAGVGPGRVALVLPDPVVRVTILPRDEGLPRGRAQAEEVLRFKLRKSVPFEIRDARLVWSQDRVGQGGTVVAAVFRPILDGYEAACRSLGREPGAVHVSGLALLAASTGDPDQDWVLVNRERGYVTLAVVRRGWPLLFRTLTGSLGDDPGEVARELSKTILYHRERLAGVEIGQCYVRCGAGPWDELREALGATLGFAPDLIDPLARLKGGDLGPGGQAVAGAVAALIEGRS